jgi:hypothetical protein
MIKRTKLFDAAINAIRNNPDSSRKKQFDDFWETIRSDTGYFKSLAEDYFYAQAKSWEAKEGDNGSLNIVGTPSKERQVISDEKRREAAAERAERNERAQEELAAKIRPFIWFEMEMPNGKKLRHCTGAELSKFGGIFTELSTHLKPTERLDSKLGEMDIRNIASRFDGSKRRSASRDLHA